MSSKYFAQFGHQDMIQYCIYPLAYDLWAQTGGCLFVLILSVETSISFRYSYSIIECWKQM